MPIFIVLDPFNTSIKTGNGWLGYAMLCFALWLGLNVFILICYKSSGIVWLHLQIWGQVDDKPWEEWPLMLRSPRVIGWYPWPPPRRGKTKNLRQFPVFCVWRNGAGAMGSSAAQHSAESHFYKPHNCCHQGVARPGRVAGDVCPGFTTTTPPHKNCSRIFQCSTGHPKYSFKRKL